MATRRATALIGVPAVRVGPELYRMTQNVGKIAPIIITGTRVHATGVSLHSFPFTLSIELALTPR